MQPAHQKFSTQSLVLNDFVNGSRTEGNEVVVDWTGKAEIKPGNLQRVITNKLHAHVKDMGFEIHHHEFNHWTQRSVVKFPDTTQAAMFCLSISA